MNTELKYKTFDQLLDEVAIDFTMHNTERMIEPAQLIKVAQRVNYDLGLRINGTKEKVLHLEKGKVRLPDDFYVLNYAYMCTRFTTCYPANSGRHTENVIVGTGECPKCKQCFSDCPCQITYVQECQNGESIFVQVVEKRQYETRIYDSFDRIIVSPDTGKKDALEAAGYVVYIKNGFLYANFDHGEVFISYQGALEDDEGNLLVLDHPMINDYYEYALKQRLLENLFINGEDVGQKLQLIEQRLRAARNNALTIVNTPNFSEMYQLWQANRKAQYHKYYDMFKSYYEEYWNRPGYHYRKDP